MAIVAFDSRLGDLADPAARVEKIATGFEFTEGPVWHSRDRTLTFSDVRGGSMYRWTEGGGVEVFRRPSGGGNGNTYDFAGRLITCEHANRRVSRTAADGTIETLASHYDGKRLNSPNDVIVTPDGDIIFTDPPYGLQPPHGVESARELPFNGVYRLDADGTITLLVDDFDRPNGLAFSPDERLLYIDDTARGHIRRFVVSAEGQLSEDMEFAVLAGDGRGRPDGMTVDREGNVYCTGPGGVWVFSPLAEVIGRIRVPEQTANVGWGDDDWQTLYLTASTSLYRIRLGIPGIPVG